MLTVAVIVLVVMTCLAMAIAVCGVFGIGEVEETVRNLKSVVDVLDTEGTALHARVLKLEQDAKVNDTAHGMLSMEIKAIGKRVGAMEGPRPETLGKEESYGG